MSEAIESYRLPLDSHLEKLEKIVRENPDDPSSLMAFGEMAFRRGRNLIALSAFHRVMEMRPEVLEVHLALAKIYGEQKMYDEAYREIAETYKLDPANVEARVICEVLFRELVPPEAFQPQIKELLASSVKIEDVNLYLEQLAVEKRRLGNDIRELTGLLESSPMDTVLEYNKNMAARRLLLVEELSAKAEELKPGKSATVPSKPQVTNAPSRQPAQSTSTPEVKKPVPKSESAELPESEKTVVWLIGALDPIMQGIKKTKGVSAILVAGTQGKIYNVISDEKIDLSPVATVLSEMLGSLFSFSSDLVYWVMEFQQGLLVLQTIAPNLVLLIVADSSTSFGALRYLMDKNHSLIVEALKSVEIGKLEA